jgi:site-specific DNA recombinase
VDETLSRGHCQLPLDFADRVVVSRLLQHMEATGRTMSGQQPAPMDVAPLKARENEIELLMAELVEDRAAGLLERAAVLTGTAKLREELAGIRKSVLEAGRRETADEEFGKLALVEQRAVLRDAFTFIRVIPRGKGRPKAGQPTWRAALIETEFTPAWSP